MTENTKKTASADPKKDPPDKDIPNSQPKSDDEFEDETYKLLKRYKKARQEEIKDLVDHEALAEQLQSQIKSLQKQNNSVPLYKLEEMHMQEMQTRQVTTQNDPNRYETQDYRNYDDIMHWSKSNENLPKFYQDLNLPPEMRKFNIGNKLAAQMVSSITKRRDFERSFKKGIGSYIYQSVKRGRLGVDLYFLIFAMVGTLAIPYYYYQKGRPFKKIVEDKRKIIDDVMDKAENSKYDIDDISLHENYNTLYQKEIENYKVEKFKVKREIRKLEKELYKDKIE